MAAGLKKEMSMHRHSSHFGISYYAAQVGWELKLLSSHSLQNAEITSVHPCSTHFCVSTLYLNLLSTPVNGSTNYSKNSGIVTHTLNTNITQ